LEGFAEYYSVELAEKIKRGMTENALKLRSNGVRAPIGYYIDDEKHFQIDETMLQLSKTYLPSITMARKSARSLN